MFFLFYADVTEINMKVAVLIRTTQVEWVNERNGTKSFVEKTLRERKKRIWVFEEAKPR